MTKRNENRPGYKKTKVGWIPEEWEIKPLGVFGSFSKGKGISNSDKKNAGLPCITYGEIYTKHDYVIKDFYSFIDKETARTSQRIKKFDVLFTGSGETLDEIGKCVAFTNDIEAYAGGDIVIFHPKNINSIYLSYSLNSEFITRYRRKLGQGHSVVHIYSSGLKNLLTPLPPLPEQKKIAEILSAWDRVIDQVGKLIDAKQRLKKGLMQQLLTGRMRFPEFGKPSLKKGELPEGWKIKRLDLFGAFLKGKGISNSEKKESGFPCVTYGEIYTKHEFVIKEFFSFIDKYTAQKSQRIQKSDILFAGSGETLDEIGKCVAFTKDIEAYAGGDIVIFRPKSIDSLYLSYLLNSDLLIRQKRKLGQGHSVVHIYSAGLKTLQVPLPCLAEQSRIAAVLSTCDREIELLKKKQKKLKEQKKGLMQKLLTGEVRVVTQTRRG